MMVVVFRTTFFKNLWADGEGLAFVHGDHSKPTAYFWIHATLALTSLVLGVLVGWIGLRALRARRAEAPPTNTTTPDQRLPEPADHS